MTVVTQKLLPSAKIVAKKKTIPVSALKPVEIENSTETSSIKEKLVLIKNFLGEKYESELTSWRMKRRQRQEEKRKLREEKIEKKKETKLALPKVNVNPFSNIFSSISNFLLFLGGGLLFNKFLDLQDGLTAVEKVLPAIEKGISIFTGVISGVTNFIDSAYAGYDKFKKQISEITGVKEEDVEEFAGLLNKVVNGTIIAVGVTLRSLPRLLKNRKVPTSSSSSIPKTPKTGQFGGGQKTGIDLKKGTRTIKGRKVSVSSASRYTKSVSRFIKGTANVGDMTRLLRRGFFKPFAQFSSPLLERIPIIGGIVDFLVNFFLFKEPLGKSAFLAAGSTLGGFIGGILGSVAGPPGAIAGGVLGGIGGDWAARALYETIFGDVDLDLAAGLTENASYDLISDITTNIIQPIET